MTPTELITAAMPQNNAMMVMLRSDDCECCAWLMEPASSGGNQPAFALGRQAQPGSRARPSLLRQTVVAPISSIFIT